MTYYTDHRSEGARLIDATGSSAVDASGPRAVGPDSGVGPGKGA
jgi:hypothetical protein